MKPLRESFAEAEVVQHMKRESGEYVLFFRDGRSEIWFANPNHASYGIVTPDGIELEFARSN